MTNEEKEKLFLEFHSIRSGLSLIHDNEKEIDQINADLQKQTDERKALDEECNSLSIKIRNNEIDIVQLESEIEDSKRRIEDNNDQTALKKDVKKEFPTKWLVGLILVSIVYLVIIIVSLVVFLKTSNGPTSEEGRKDFLVMFLLPVGVGFVFVGIPVIGLAANLHNELKDWKNRKKDILNCRERTNAVHDNRIETNKSKISHLESDNVTCKEKIEENKRKLALPVEIPNRLVELERENSIILASLVENHTAVICREDWKYMDLIMFYLNSGRAETLKEALQLVDRQVQTNQIVESIENLNESLNSTLIQGFKFLGDVVDSSIQSLSFQISTLSRSVMKSNSLILKEVDIQKSLVDNLHTNSVELCSKLDKIQEASKFSEEKIIDAVNKIVKNTSN